MAPRPLLLGHRGARHHAPENTLKAFELSLTHGCDGFEVDVRRSADAQAVICHDAKLGRREIAITACKNLGAPTLEDILADFGPRAFLDIELKVPGLEALVKDLLRRYPPQRGYCVSSFLPEVVESLYQIDREMNLGLICRWRAQLAGWTGVPAQTLFLERGLCSAAAVDALHRAGKQVFVWTVNREREMRVFGEIGVDGIISDDTALLGKTLSSVGAEVGGFHEKR